MSPSTPRRPRTRHFERSEPTFSFHFAPAKWSARAERNLSSIPDASPAKDQIGSLDPGKLVYPEPRRADLIAVQGDPLTDIIILRQVKFVMKCGAVVVDTFHTPAN